MLRRQALSIGDFINQANRIAQLIYQGEWDGKTIDKQLTSLVAEKLLEYYSKGIEDIQIQPDVALQHHLQNNVYHFAGAKNYQQLKTLSQAVLDPDTGAKRSFSEFKKIALQVDEQYNKIWLRSEQDQAYASAQMAAKWHDFESDENLKYKTAGDGRVRPQYQQLNDIVKPRQDTFWNSFYPPNGWGCRCNVIATNDDSTDQSPDISEKDIPKLFRVNTAKQGLLFPPEHPYYQEVPKSVKKQAEQLYTEKLNKENP